VIAQPPLTTRQVAELLAVEGRCPACGVEGELIADPERAGLWHLVFRHEDDCPVASDDPKSWRSWEPRPL
jgi:hypothetical protein